MSANPIIITYLTAVLVIASLVDYRSFRIPNWLTFSTLAAGISYLTIMKGWEGFLFSISGAAAGFGLLIMPFIIGGTGAGDVKLLGAIGSFLGPHGIFAVFILSCILGAVYALLLLAWKGFLFGTFKRYGMILKGFIITQHFIYIPPSNKEMQLRIRFGLAIALGTVSYLVLGF